MINQKLKAKVNQDRFENPTSFTLYPKVETKVLTFNLAFKIDAENLATKIINLQSQYQQSFVSNVKAWHTHFHIHKETNIFDDLIQIVESKVPKCFPVPQQIEASVEDCWAAIYKKGDKAIRHKHIDTCYSAVYYCIADSTPLIFDNHLTIIPEPNMLILFPGYLYHAVPEVIDDAKRICVAFNINCYYTSGKFYEKN